MASFFFVTAVSSGACLIGGFFTLRSEAKMLAGAPELTASSPIDTFGYISGTWCLASNLTAGTTTSLVGLPGDAASNIIGTSQGEEGGVLAWWKDISEIRKFENGYSTRDVVSSSSSKAKNVKIGPFIFIDFERFLPISLVTRLHTPVHVVGPIEDRMVAAVAHALGGDSSRLVGVETTIRAIEPQPSCTVFGTVVPNNRLQPHLVRCDMSRDAIVREAEESFNSWTVVWVTVGAIGVIGTAVTSRFS